MDERRSRQRCGRSLIPLKSEQRPRRAVYLIASRAGAVSAASTDPCEASRDCVVAACPSTDSRPSATSRRTRSGANKPLACADLHMWNFRRKHLAASVSSDKPQLGRTPRLAAGESPGCELVPFTFDRGAAVAQIDELTHRTEAATPFAGPTGTVAQLIAGDPAASAARRNPSPRCKRR